MQSTEPRRWASPCERLPVVFSLLFFWTWLKASLTVPKMFILLWSIFSAPQRFLLRHLLSVYYITRALLSFVIPQIHEVLLHAGMQTRDSGVLSTPAGYYAQDGANCWSSSHSTRGCYPQDGANCWCRMCTVHYETPTCIEATTATTFFNGDTWRWPLTA